MIGLECRRRENRENLSFTSKRELASFDILIKSVVRVVNSKSRKVEEEHLFLFPNKKSVEQERNEGRRKKIYQLDDIEQLFTFFTVATTVTTHRLLFQSGTRASASYHSELFGNSPFKLRILSFFFFF